MASFEPKGDPGKSLNSAGITGENQLNNDDILVIRNVFK